MKGALVAVDTTVGADTEAARDAKSLQLHKNELCDGRVVGASSSSRCQVPERIPTIAKLQAGLPGYNIKVGKNGQPRPGYGGRLAVPKLRSITLPGV